MDVDELQPYEGGDGVASTSELLLHKRSHPSASQTVHLQIDEAFDIDAYIAPYEGRRRIERLLFIARSCPELRDRARQLALKAIETSSLDYKLYLHIIADGDGKAVHGDERWIEDARVKQESGREKLDVELKNYQNNLIKESIRVRTATVHGSTPLTTPFIDGIQRYRRLQSKIWRFGCRNPCLWQVEGLLHNPAACPRHVSECH